MLAYLFLPLSVAFIKQVAYFIDVCFTFFCNGYISEGNSEPQVLLTNAYMHTYTVGMNNIQYTVRNVPEDLDKKLRLRSKKSGQSFNMTLIQALRSSIKNPKSQTGSDIDWLYGSGGIGKEELQAFADQRAIDKGAWNLK